MEYPSLNNSVLVACGFSTVHMCQCESQSYKLMDGMIKSAEGLQSDVVVPGCGSTVNRAEDALSGGSGTDSRVIPSAVK